MVPGPPRAGPSRIEDAAVDNCFGDGQNRVRYQSRLALPVLLTAGRYDEATPATTEYYRGLVPGAQLKILENSAHLTMQDEPDVYVQAVREFLHEVESR